MSLSVGSSVVLDHIGMDKNTLFKISSVFLSLNGFCFCGVMLNNPPHRNTSLNQNITSHVQMQIQRETYCRSLESDALCGQTNFLLLVHCFTRSCNVMVVQYPYIRVRINCCESDRSFAWELFWRPHDESAFIVKKHGSSKNMVKTCV